jgi:hypothetical protein
VTGSDRKIAIPNASPDGGPGLGRRLLLILACGAGAAVMVGLQSYMMYQRAEQRDEERAERDVARRRNADRMVREMIGSLPGVDSDRAATMSHEELSREMMRVRMVTALIKQLEDEDSAKRKMAADLLGFQGRYGARAIPALEKLLKDKDEGARKAAATAIRRLKASQKAER